MKPHRVRQICRSHNPFTPSIALWQHFILPWQPLRQQRPLSTAVAHATSSSPNPEAALPLPLSPPSPPIELQNGTAGQDGLQFEVRKVWDTREENQRRGSQRPVKGDKLVLATSKQIEQMLLKAKTAFDDSGDYEGVIVEALKSSQSTSENLLPWVVRQTPEAPRPALDRLSLEIAKFHEYAKPSRNETLARKKVIEQVRTHVRQVLPEYVLEVFGSERTGIALATSDIDLRLMKRGDLADGSNKKPPSPSERKTLLGSLHKLQRNKFYKNQDYLLPLLRHARYPLISLQDRASGLDVQIVLANDTSTSRDLMQQYTQEYPYLRQLYTLVKTIFDARGLSDVFRGGFGSYSIFMMIVASLRHKQLPRNDPAGALQNFLSFWGEFDTSTKGISIEPPVIFEKSEELVMSEKTKQQILNGTRKPLPKYMLCLRDPADETNDLGRKGICIKHVQATLRSLDRKLRLDLKMDKRDSFLKPLVGDIYTLNKARRSKLEQHGRYVLEQMHSSIAASAKAIREGEMNAKKE